MEVSMAAGEIKWADIALQGGGSHGAFTWGVLDRLLEEERGSTFRGRRTRCCSRHLLRWIVVGHAQPSPIMGADLKKLETSHRLSLPPLPGLAAAREIT